ncbi:MAG: nucleoside phosphorylase [Anaerolineae bacterium]
MPETLPSRDYPILEYDPSPASVIQPHLVVKRVDIPERCVLCFFGDQVARLVAEGRARQVTEQRSEMGVFPVYAFEHGGQELALLQPGIGAPLSAGLLEEIIARGCRKFIVCGGAGVLDREIACGHLLVPTEAVRDEGTSYHYLPPSRRAAAHPAAVAAIEQVLTEAAVPYLRITTWTTDAFYRETPARVAARRAEGCLSVEMEAAALFAVAQFRGVPLGQILYAGDDVSGVDWDPRDWHIRHVTRAGVLELAAEACLRL